MMKHQTFIHKSIYLVMLVLGMLASCQPQTLPTPIGSSPMQISPTKSFPTPVPSPTLTQSPLSPIPATHYQLTFVSECREESQCMFTIDMGCLESEQPSISEPQLLFEISKQGQGPRPPISPYAWSPDGQKVAIEATGLRGQGDIFVGDWAGQNWINLTNSPNYEGEPAWGPGGSYITYIASSGEPDYKIQAFKINSVGGEAVQLLNTLGLVSVGQPSWSPEGNQLVFRYSDENGYYQLFIANPDGSGLRQLTYLREDHFLPSFSPDGQWIVYTRETEKSSGISNIYLIRFNGTEEIALTQDTNSWKSRPIWSPLGDWIAFTSEVDGHSVIYLIRSDGTGLTRVTESNVDEFAPTWRILSP